MWSPLPPRSELDSIAAQFERDDRATAALLNDIQRKRALAAANEIDAEKKLPYRDVPPDGGWKNQSVKAKAQVTPGIPLDRSL